MLIEHLLCSRPMLDPGDGVKQHGPYSLGIYSLLSSWEYSDCPLPLPLTGGVIERNFKPGLKSLLLHSLAV